MFRHSFIIPVSVFAVFVPTVFAQAQSIGQETLQAVVYIVCDDRQGSGTVINGFDGYVLTDGHVALDPATLVAAEECRIAFANQSGTPTHFYHASIVHAVFNNTLNQDFAILKIEKAIDIDTIPRPFPYLKTNEFTSRGDVITVLGYSGARNRLEVRNGHILDYVGGFIRTDAVVSPGDSGGAAVDINEKLIGVPTRIVTITNGHDAVFYELVDIRAVMIWLDTFGPNEHDKFFTHADFNRYHKSAVFITQTNLGCSALGRSVTASPVYCLMPDGTRLPFPNDKTYFSWYSDFSDIVIYSDSSIGSFQLLRNVTFKPGTLVKSATGPNVYVVVDAFGTMRWIPSEQKAIELWGPAWAGLVFDIPDEFWTNYKIGQPLE